MEGFAAGIVTGAFLMLMALIFLAALHKPDDDDEN